MASGCCFDSPPGCSLKICDARILSRFRRLDGPWGAIIWQSIVLMASARRRQHPGSPRGRAGTKGGALACQGGWVSPVTRGEGAGQTGPLRAEAVLGERRKDFKGVLK